MRLALVTSLLFAVAGCGGDDNVADCEKGRSQVPCSERTTEEDARLALDAGDAENAVLLYEELVTDDEAELTADDAERYRHRPLLAAAYAMRAGFNVREGIKAQFGGSKTLLEAVTGFLPSPADPPPQGYDAALDDMERSTTALKDIPVGFRDETSDTEYAPSVAIQLTLYQACFAFMLVNKFAISATSGTYDPAQLQSMSEEDADRILATLTDASQIPGVTDPKLQEKINNALADIDGQDGASRSEKLKAFLEKEQNPTSEPTTTDGSQTPAP